MSILMNQICAVTHSAPHSHSEMRQTRLWFNFQDPSPRKILDTLVRLPVPTWNLKSQPPGIRHIGPVAQDFRAAFGLGTDDKSIGTVDADGVALAAIQGLNQKLNEKVTEVRELRARLERLESLVTPMDGGAK